LIETYFSVHGHVILLLSSYFVIAEHKTYMTIGIEYVLIITVLYENG